jgi:raffinose/stachyose/melibiose transport system substrate-binding protein
MKMRTVRSLIALGAMLLAAAVAGAQGKAVTLTFGTHQSGLPVSGIVQKLGADFEKETGIKIDFQIVPDAQWRDLLKAKIQAGEAPDIFCSDADPLSLYDRVRPDTSCVDLSKQEFVKRMAPSVLPAISYKGKVYGITFPGEKIWVYFYNKDLFAKLGLKAPTNYAEFKAISAKIAAAGIVPVYEALQNGWHQVLPLFESGPLYQTTNPALYDKLNANTFNIKDIPQLNTIISQLKEFADLGYYGKDFMSNSIEGDYKAIAEGKAGMVLEGIGWGTQAETDYPDLKGKLGIFVMPWGDNRIIGINPASNAYFGNVKSKKQKEILQFFAFLARHDNLQKRSDGDPQALAMCWPEIATKYPKDYADYLGKLKRGTVMQAAVKYVDSQWMDVGKDLEAMYAGASTVDQVMQTISQRRDEQAKLQKDPAWK